MIVRKIREHEYRRCHELDAMAFEFPSSAADQTPEEFFREAQRHVENRQDAYPLEFWAAFEDDDTTMMSCMQATPFKARFEGEVVGMAGIGGVATMPQYRRKGCIRACFQHALQDMYDNGTLLTSLHAFSTVYYRQFGYELCSINHSWKITLSALPAFKTEGRCVLLEKSNAAALKKDVMRIDDAFGSRYNCMFVGEDIEYIWMEQTDPFRDRRYTYVYYDAQGAAQGYMSYFFPQNGQERQVKCSHFMFLNAEGLMGLLSLLKSLESRHTHIVFSLPEDIHLDGVLPEWSFEFMECTRQWIGMVRVVDAAKALQMARPRGEGRVVVEVEDSMLPQNCGRFAVTFALGRKNLVERTEDAPDMSLSIGDLTRLIMGRYNMDELALHPQIRVTGDPAQLAKLFYRKPICMMQRF